jgi:hypothetical protein
MSQILCCECRYVYPIKLFEAVGTGLPITVCPNCGLVHTVDFQTEDISLDDNDLIHIPQQRLKDWILDTYCGSAIGEDAAAGSQNESEAKSDWDTGDKFWVAVKVHCAPGGKNPVASDFSLQWQEQGGSWADLGAAGELKYAGDDNMVITDETLANTYTIVAAACEAAVSDPMYLTDDLMTSVSVDIASSDTEVELWWAIDPAGAVAGKTYEFGIFDSRGEIGTSGTPQLIASTITIVAVGALEIDVSDSLTNIETLD